MRRSLLSVTLVLAAVSLWQAVGPSRWNRAYNLSANSLNDAPSWRLRKVPAAQVSLTYELGPDRWLTFDLPADVPVVRVMTTADLPLARRGDFPTPLPDEVKWPYAVTYQLLDRRGHVLAERDAHQATRLSEYRDPDLDETINPSFYLGGELVPCDTRSLIIRLDEVEGAARLRLRLASMDQPLTRASARVYYPGEAASYKLRYLWRRLPAARVRSLARGNVFDAELLTEQEKLNLLRQRLAPLAPVGSDGRDYRQHELYVLREIDGEAVREAPLPAGLQVDQHRRAIIPLPEAGGTVRLEMRGLGGPAARAGEVRLHWQGKKLTRRETFVVPWDGQQATFEKALEGGVLEVECAEALVVRAFLPAAKASGKRLRAEADEITPELITTWTYLLQGDAAVEVPVQPSDDPTPLRVDVRQVWPVGGKGERLPASEVVYEVLDASKVIRRGALKADEPASLYDRLHQHRQDRFVSEPKASYFAIPPGARRLRFLPTTTAVAVSVFNRPAKLAKAVNVPADYHRFNRDEVAQRSWFLMRAANHAALELKNRVPMLALQARPSDDDPDLLAGVFEWQDHLPGGNWRGRELLVPRDVRAPFRREALAVTFRKLRLDRVEKVTFAAEPGRLEVAPVLVLVREEEAPLTVQVYLDGQLHHRATVRAARVELPLPPLRLRRGAATAVRVTASRPVVVYLNQHDPGTRPAVVKRLAMRLGREGLVFDYDKSSAQEELLSLFLFQPHGGESRSVVRARLEGGAAPGFGPFASWTLRERRYEVSSPKGGPVAVLATSGEAADEGQTCFFPVGADLPPGRYRVRVELEGGPGGYVILARTTPGEYERRAFFLEHPAGGER